MNSHSALLRIRQRVCEDEKKSLHHLVDEVDLSLTERDHICDLSRQLITLTRDCPTQGLMEKFLEEYGMSTEEGISLMSLAESLLRTPDKETVNALIEDKITNLNWREHLGKSDSPLVNFSTLALLYSDKILQTEATSVSQVFNHMLKRFGEPVIRQSLHRAMKMMGGMFVKGRDIREALTHSKTSVKQGYRYSYDMLGEGAVTQQAADDYYEAYADAIQQIARTAHSSATNPNAIFSNPSISVKLSALHPRFESSKRKQLIPILIDRLKALTLLAKSAHIGLTIDAEECHRLELSLEVVDALLSEPNLKHWDGLGVAIQSYSKRTRDVIDWLGTTASERGRKLMIRLVKGAYWDSEIKTAQIDGMHNYPVFTRKSATDVAYITHAKKLLKMGDTVYPQFATHNAHTAAAILQIARSVEHSGKFEFQRLHGMGENLHHILTTHHQTHCRIYAPVGQHKDLLAYLVRRLLENGANSSFVNQIMNKNVPIRTISSDPFLAVERYLNTPDNNPSIQLPKDLYLPERANSTGWDLHYFNNIEKRIKDRDIFRDKTWQAKPILAEKYQPKTGNAESVLSPTDGTQVGEIWPATQADTQIAINAASVWSAPQTVRRDILNQVSDLYESHASELFALLAREAGKTWQDAVAELREAVDFLRYYASQISSLNDASTTPLGKIVCISPWNFPLAIFTGQISAALAAGNAVIAKPSRKTTLIAAQALSLFHAAGVPRNVLQLLPGNGRDVGMWLLTQNKVDGVCFTGSMNSARKIEQNIADHLSDRTPLIAETGGINAMIIDSTALPEQAIKDVIVSAFQSAGQRCSALRILYLQADIAVTFKQMLFDAIDQLSVADPWEISSDIGPIIDEQAKREIIDYIEQKRQQGKVCKQGILQKSNKKPIGNFIPPTVIEVEGIAALNEEIFGPVLHITTFESTDMMAVVDAINSAGYGLTFGIHSRIQEHIDQVSRRIKMGNVYVNRNQIGAVVGTQPFGGEGLSGTGPKAGGPHYLQRLIKTRDEPRSLIQDRQTLQWITKEALQHAIDNIPSSKPVAQRVIDCPGPTGERNQLSLYPREMILCLGPDKAAAQAQSSIAHAWGGAFLEVIQLITKSQELGTGKLQLYGRLDPKILSVIQGFDAVAYWGSGNEDDPYAKEIRQALANRTGALIPLLDQTSPTWRYAIERHVCTNTTAFGGNVALLSINQTEDA